MSIHADEDLEPRWTQRPVNRRSFLTGGLYAAAAVGGALSLAGCSSTGHKSVPRPKRLDWAQLAAAMTGSLILPSNPSYAIDSELYNAKFTNLTPQAIAYVASSEDVARCIDFVRVHGIPVTSRSGGHSYGGYSSCDGLVIDVSQLSSILVAGTSATVGAGSRLIDVYNTIGNQGMLLPGGSCPTVGIAGLTLGGGVGVFARSYGILADNLQSVSIVTADARQLAVSPESDADLFWACQGGGGGNFGVVTSFDFTVHPIPPISLFTLQFPFAAAADVLGSWQQWLSSIPDELWSNCLVLSKGAPQGGYLVQIGGVFCGSQSDLSDLLAPLLSAIGTAPSYEFVGSEEYLNAMMIEGGCAGLTVAACHSPMQNPAGTLQRSSFSAKSGYLNVPMSSAQLSAAVRVVSALATEIPAVNGGLAFDSYGGAINQVDGSATAFIHRDMLCGIQASYTWPTGTSSADVQAGSQWLQTQTASVLPPAQGAYQNYIDPTLAGWQDAYYGSNLSKLISAKDSYDPDDLFHFAQSIPTSA